MTIKQVSRNFWKDINLSLDIKKTCNIYYKFKEVISPTIMNKMFQFVKNPVYELRSGCHLPNRNSRTGFSGFEPIINLGAKLWNVVHVNKKSSESPNIFKSKIKYWTPNHSPWWICKTYIGQVCIGQIGFVNYFFSFCLSPRYA